MPQEYNDKLLGGIILTGGGSKMKNIKKAFANITKIQKIRIAGTVTMNVTSTDKDVNARNGMMNTVIGLLARGDMNCAGSAINPNADLFSSAGAPTSGNTGDIHTKPRKPGEMGNGVVMTEAEKQRAEEERKRKADAEAIRIKEEMEEKRRQEELERNKGGFFKRTAASLKNFASKLVAEEPEEEDDKR